MICQRLALVFLGSIFGIVLLSATPAAEKVAKVKKVADAPVKEEDVKKAIDRGVAYLKKSQAKDGSWNWGHDQGSGKSGIDLGYDTNAEISSGVTALAALALLEAGVPAKDDAIQKAAAYLRQQVPALTLTHAIGATIFFLDRLEDEQDAPTVKTLAVRLLAGQSRDGGWGYQCPEIATQTVANWTKPADYSKGLAKAIKEAAIAARKRGDQKIFVGMRGITENSTSEFAILGLWIGRRRGVPVQVAMSRYEKYCRKSQNADGTFPYSSGMRNAERGTPCLTCAGLLGLVHCFGASNEAALLKYAKSKGGTKPPVPGKGLRNVAADPAVKKGFAALETSMGPAPARPRQPKVEAALQLMPPPDFWDSKGPWFYMALWSVERVGKAYGQDKLIKIDWYNWGARLLLPEQAEDGNWGSGKARFPGVGGPDLQTAFALLFLRKADLSPDVAQINQGTLPQKLIWGISSESMKQEQK